MRKTRTAIATALLTATLAQPAMATNGWYGGPFLMGGFTDHDKFERTPSPGLPIDGQSDSMLAGGGGGWIGYDFGNVNIELGGSYRARYDANYTFQDITTSNPNFGAKANVQTADIMVSALYDIPTSWKLQPYLGGGIGVAHHMLDNELLTTTITDAGSSSTTNFAWQVQTGVKYPMWEHTNLRFEYRYTDQGRMETSPLPTGTNDRLSSNLTSHDLRLGLSWDF